MSSNSKPTVLLLNPFHVGSHAQWAEAVRDFSAWEVELVSLPGRHWKWRMHGAAVAFAQRLPRPVQADLLLVTDMLDLATLRGLRPDLAGVPTILYMHENQLTIPWSPNDPDVEGARDKRYAWINYTSVLAADEVWFASAYHRQVFAKALPGFLRAFPEGKKLPRPAEDKFHVYPLPLRLSKLVHTPRHRDAPRPVLLWNHRWEYDKGPEEFWAIIDALADEGLDFSLIVCGEQYEQQPAVFAKAKARHADRILHWGYVASRVDYEKLLLQADLSPVTSKHDFFGISVVEALAAGVACIVPRRFLHETVDNPYGEHLLPEKRESMRVATRIDLQSKIRSFVSGFQVSVSGDPIAQEQRAFVLKYDAATVLRVYDEAFERVMTYSSRLSS